MNTRGRLESLWLGVFWGGSIWILDSIVSHAAPNVPHGFQALIVAAYAGLGIASARMKGADE